MSASLPAAGRINRVVLSIYRRDRETATSTTIGNEPQLPSSIAPPAHPTASSSIAESASGAFTPPSLEDPIGVDPAKGQLPEKEQYGVVRDQADLLIQQLGNGTSGFLK